MEESGGIPQRVLRFSPVPPYLAWFPLASRISWQATAEVIYPDGLAATAVCGMILCRIGAVMVAPIV